MCAYHCCILFIISICFYFVYMIVVWFLFWFSTIVYQVCKILYDCGLFKVVTLQSWASKHLFIRKMSHYELPRATCLKKHFWNDGLSWKKPWHWWHSNPRPLGCKACTLPLFCNHCPPSWKKRVYQTEKQTSAE